MDSKDQGFFQYNDLYPPLCLEPVAETEKEECKQAMEGSVTAYLQESYREGLKHEHTLLPNGLCAGEAALHYFRDLNQKRRKSDWSSCEVQQLLSKIQKTIEHHFEIQLKEGKDAIIFTKHINATLFQGKGHSSGPWSQPHMRRIDPALKKMVGELNLKNKGYLAKLKTIKTEVQAMLENAT